MPVFDAPGDLGAPRRKFRGWGFAKSDNAGGSPGRRLAGLDLDPAKRLGGLDLLGEDGKAAEELASGLSAPLAGENGKETVKAFAGDGHHLNYHLRVITAW